MKISIITINYNNAPGLRKTIESVKNQVYDEYEFIVIDGASTDGSVEIVKEYEQYVKLWISEKDNGIYDAMNKGITASQGEFLMFLNSGDCLSERSILSVCSEFIKENKNVDIFYGDIYGISETVKEPWLHTHPNKLNLLFWKESNINHQAALIKASLFNEFGHYPSLYKYAGDHWIFFKSFITGKIFKHIPVPLIIYDYGGISATNTVVRNVYYNERMAMWDTFLPDYIHNLISDYDKSQFFLNKKPFKLMVDLYKNLSLIKKRFKKNS